MDGQFVWMLQGRVDAHGEALDQANEVVDSADPGGEVVDTMVTGDMVKGVMVTDPSEVAIGALVVAAAGTGVEDTLQVATEIIGVREDMLTALEPTAMDTTAMTGELHLRSGRLFMKSVQGIFCALLNICILNVL